MKFERIRPGELRAKLGSSYLWIFKEWRKRRWWWVVGAEDGYALWYAEGHHGPFKSLRAAIADAIANHELSP
jgi:hypothetical protein